MSANSKIEWTDHTFNPWIGCTKVSPGCLNCYAAARDTRFSQGMHWGKGAPRQRTSAANWKEPLRWNREAAKHRQCAVCKATTDFGVNAEGFCEQCEVEAFPVRQRVFCASLADWLDEEVPTEWRVNLLELIHATPNLDWLLLTKRPENWQRLLEEAFQFACDHGDPDHTRQMDFTDWLGGWAHAHLPPANVWIGTTVEDQARADQRIPVLLEIPAQVRFLSCEPLLGAVEIAKWLVPDDCGCGGYDPAFRECVNWVICGGESGPSARPMHPGWARALRDQCQAAGVAFHFKQWGEYEPATLHLDGREIEVGDAIMRRVGKKAAGRELDGRTWHELPEAPCHR